MKTGNYVFIFLMGLLLSHNIFSMIDVFRMAEEMHQAFEQMATRAQSNWSSEPDYHMTVAENNDKVVIKMTLDARIPSDAISVEIDNNILYVVIIYGYERIELKVSERRALFTASKQTYREQDQDEKGAPQAYSSGSVHSSQMFDLPARVDFINHKPQADYSKGVLTITLAKKGTHKIPVNVVEATVESTEIVDEK